VEKAIAEIPSGRSGRAPFYFHSFRIRLLTFVLGLIVLVQGAVLLAVNAANVREARRHIDEALELTAGAFRRSLQSRNQILLEKARLLSSDFAFKEASATGDHATLLSALENHQARVGADVMMLLETSGDVFADTLHPDVRGGPSPLVRLVEVAMDTEFGEASFIESIDGNPYQLVVVPLFTPAPDSWIVIGFAIGDALAEELQRETNTHVSLLWRQRYGWEGFCSTLDPLVSRELADELAAGRYEQRQSLSMTLAGKEFVSWISPVANDGIDVVAVLQRSVEDALRPYLRLRTVLLAIFGLGLALSLWGGVLLATRVTRPVATLARGARRIASETASETCWERWCLPKLPRSCSARRSSSEARSERSRCYSPTFGTSRRWPRAHLRSSSWRSSTPTSRG
jgi:adenylate cyclase